MKEVLTGMAAAIGTAIIFWAWGGISKIPDIISVPSGAVVAFDAETCPSEGWKEYKAAYGRFVRGIDRSGSNVDPDGERNPGSLQEDEFKAHNHSEQRFKIGTHCGLDGCNGGPTNETVQTGSTGGQETRPRNVALLYCVKL